MICLILEPESYSPIAIETYKKIGSVHLAKTSEPDKVKVLIVRLAHQINAQMLSRFPALEAVVTPTTGLNHIDQIACAAAGVNVYSLGSVPEALEPITSTSELTLALMLALMRRIPEAHFDVRDQNRWDRDRFRGRQMSGLTLGIVGLGRIGRHMAKYASALGMKLLACDPQWPESGFEFVARRRLTELLAQSDIVSLHVKFTQDNYKMIGRKEIGAMVPGALLINTARGELLDETAAVEALETGHLGGLAVDVISNEGLTAADPTLSPIIGATRKGLNVIVTPHIGGCTQDAMHFTEEVMASFAVAKILGKVNLDE